MQQPQGQEKVQVNLTDAPRYNVLARTGITRTQTCRQPTIHQPSCAVIVKGGLLSILLPIWTLLSSARRAGHVWLSDS